MLEKIPPFLGGVPTPGPSDENKAVIANADGTYEWKSVEAATASQAVDVVFNNTLVKIPNNPAEVQKAIEEAYKRIPATRIVKMPENSGGVHDFYFGAGFLREDGYMVWLGDRYSSVTGIILSSAYISPTANHGGPQQVGLPLPGRKVHSVCCGRLGVMMLAGTESDPRSELWISGREMGGGAALLQTTTPTRVVTATTTTERIKQIFVTNFWSGYQTAWYVRDDGKLYASGYRTNYQLGTGMYSDTREYGFVQSQSGALTYAGGQKVTRVFSTGLSSWAEVTTDNNTYKLLAVGHNVVGQLGINLTGPSSGAIRDSVAEWTQCKKAQPTISDMESVGGPFKKIIATEDDPSYHSACFVLTHTNELYHTGKALGGGTNRQIFTLVDIDVIDVAATGGTDGSYIYVKSDGTLKGAGYNVDYCLGDGTVTDVAVSAPKLLGPFNASLKAKECFGAFGSAWHQFLVRTEDGSVYGAGYNISGSLGGYTENADNENSHYVTSTTWKKTYLPEPIAAGGVYMMMYSTAGASYFLGESGALYAVGQNLSGALGVPEGELTSTQFPIVVPIPNGYWSSGRWDFLNT